MDIELLEVGFSGGWDIEHDEGLYEYKPPHWTPKREYPYLASQGALLAIVKVKVRVPGATSVMIRGQTDYGFDIPSTLATDEGNGVHRIENVDFSGNLPQNVTKYYNPLTIRWSVSLNGGATWLTAGTSRNPLYVCLSLAPPIEALFRTVVHLACSNAGATTPGEALQKTWALFASGGGPRNVMAWDDSTGNWNRPLYYYKTGTKIFDSASTTADLLKNPFSSGQCGAWAALMHDALVINDCVTLAANIRPLNHGYFIVKDWLYRTAPPCQLNFASTPSGTYDMQQGSAPINLGDLRSLTTVHGQNSAPPSQKFFPNHVVLRHVDTGGTILYYDPSYGRSYSNAKNFQNVAIDGVCDAIDSLPYVYETKPPEPDEPWSIP